MDRYDKDINKNTITTDISRFDSIRATIAGVWILSFVVLSILQLNPPQAIPTSAPLTEFSAGRAIEHLKIIGRTAHPIGSPNQIVVRDYILQTLNGLGLQPQVQQTTVVSARGLLPFPAGTVQNILARINGTANTGAILLVAHYDSVLAGPGANDDGAAVSALLETAQILKAGPPLRNHIILLFTDGEEAGLLGARAFVDAHPWAKDVRLIFNFEARGNSGPSLMFETSNNNQWLIQEFAQAVPYPFASSLFFSIYQNLPNDTDFSIFKEAGLSGLNFAYIDGFTYYHSALDRVENVTEGSLQHHGSYALALSRHFGGLDLGQDHTGNAIYFDLFGHTLVHYSEVWVLPLLVLTLVVFIAVVVLGMRRRQLTFWGSILGVILFLLPVSVAAIVAFAVSAVASTVQSEFNYYSDAYNRGLYILSVAALITATTAALYALFHTKIRKYNLVVGVLVWWLLLATLSSLLLSGGSYLFVLPLLCNLVGLGVVFAAKDQEYALGWHVIALLLGSLPGIILLTPIVYLLFIALTLRLAIVASVVIVLFLGLLLPHLTLIARPKVWLLPAVASLLGLGCLLTAVATAGPSQTRPQLNNVLYGLNADSGQAIWASTDLEPDAWTSQFITKGHEIGPLTDLFPLSQIPFIHSPAPTIILAAPTAQLIEDKTAGGVRTLRVRITSPRQAPIVWVYADRQTTVLRAMINGKPVRSNGLVASEDPLPWGMIYWAMPKEGIELTLDIPAGKPATLRLIDRTDGLPALPNVLVKPRADTMQPAPSLQARFSNGTLISRAVSF
jgi:hypothetical protein